MQPSVALSGSPAESGLVPISVLAANLQTALTTPRAELPQALQATRCFSSGEERNHFIGLIRTNQFNVARQHHGHGVGFFSMAANARNVNPHQLEIKLIEAWVDDALGCIGVAEAAAARHRYSVVVHVHFKGPRCQHCSLRHCGPCDPKCKFSPGDGDVQHCQLALDLHPLSEFYDACQLPLKPPWEPCNDPAAGGSDQIYSVISGVNVRHMNMNTPARQQRNGEEQPEAHKRQHDKTHWQGGPDEDGPQWDSLDPLANEWHWQLPHERNPATSTYPLLCELLNFCFHSQSAQALRGAQTAEQGAGFVEGWEAVMDNMMSSGATGLEHHHNEQGQGTKRPHSDTTQ